MKSTINQRIKEYLERKKITAETFGKPIGVSRQAVSQWMSNMNGPNASTIIKIIEIYPDINARWLITGNFSYENENILNEPIEEYKKIEKCSKCEVNERLIKSLSEQIEGLKRELFLVTKDDSYKQTKAS
jgi:transcriptional regulator with XRE-family HTH domain